MLKIILIFMLLMPSAQADEWTQADIYRETAYMSLHTIDWLQTRTMAKEGWKNGRVETNFVLGKSPSTAQIDAYFALTSIVHVYVANLLPPDWRIAWQYLAIGDAGSVVVNNRAIGVRIRF